MAETPSHPTGNPALLPLVRLAHKCVAKCWLYGVVAACSCIVLSLRVSAQTSLLLCLIGSLVAAVALSLALVAWSVPGGESESRDSLGSLVVNGAALFVMFGVAVYSLSSDALHASTAAQQPPSQQAPLPPPPASPAPFERPTPAPPSPFASFPNGLRHAKPDKNHWVCDDDSDLPDVPILVTRHQQIALGASVGSLRLAGGGRYLLAHQPQRLSLVVIDLAQKKVVATIDAPADAEFAAGWSKLYVVNPRTKVLQRWNLAPLRIERSHLLREAPSRLVLGVAADDPLLIINDRAYGVAVLDTESLKPVDRDHNFAGVGPVSELGISPNGLVLTHWQRGYGYQLPDQDGQWIFTPEGIYGSKVGPGQSLQLAFSNGRFDSPISESPSGWLIPAVDGPLFVRVVPKAGPNDRGPRRTRVEVHVVGRRQPLARLAPFDVAIKSPDSKVNDFLEFAESVYFIPQLDVLAAIDTSATHLDVWSLDLKSVLKGVDFDYMIFRSFPPNSAQVGQRVQHQVNLLASGSLQYALGDAPTGMQIDAQGLLTWTPSAEQTGPQQVTIRVSNDRKQERLRSFKIHVAPPQ